MSDNPKPRQSIKAILRGQSPQDNYRQAYDLAISQAAKVPPDQLAELGVISESAHRLTIPVLADIFHIDLNAGKVTDQTGCDLSVSWAVLALHYLQGRPRHESIEPYISFMQVPDARGYAKPYQGRVIQRFLHGVGRDSTTFSSAAQALAAQPIDSGDIAYEFTVFPRAHLRIIWYRGDDEISPGASFVYAQDIVGIFCVEDIVVMSGELVAALETKSPPSSRKSK